MDIALKTLSHKPKSINRLKQLLVVFACALVLTPLLGSIVRPTRVAAATDSVNDQLAQEYKTWASFNFVSFCMDRSADTLERGTDEYSSAVSWMRDLTDFFSITPSAEVGLIVEPSDGELDCGTGGDLLLALRNIGYPTIKDFMEEFYPPDGTGCDGDDCAHRDVNKMRDRIQDRIRDKGWAGPDGAVNSLSDAGQYWFWRHYFKTTCGATAYTKDDKGELPREYKIANSSKKNEKEPMSAWIYRTTEVDIQERNFFTFKIDDQNGIEELGFDFAANPYNTSTGKDMQAYNCVEIGNNMKKGIAQKYLDLYTAAINKCKQAGSTVQECNDQAADDAAAAPSGSGPGGDAEDKATCETAGNAAGWIICPFYNMFAEGTAFFYKSILQPFLTTPPVDVTPGAENKTFEAWSNFRFYGNMFLVIAMIIIVFGQSIGGGLIDAYTAKKVMPRILVAAIMINISIYLVAILVDVTNAVGNGISALIMAPFDTSFTVGPSTAIAGIIGTLIGAGVGAGSIAGFVGAATSGGVSSVFMLLLMSVVIPLLLALLGVFVTLVIRQGIITALVLVSPVAFALYCLPNTEKYFKKWWETLSKALLVYPIVMAIFAVSNVMSLLVMQGNITNTASWTDFSNWSVSDGIAGLVALFIQIIPLFMVPFAFKFAGGAMSSLYAAIEGGGKKAGGMLKSRQEQTKKDYNAVALQARQRQYDRLGSIGSRSRLARPVTGFLQNRVGGRNLHLALAEMTADQFKEMDAQKATGIDDEQRGLSVNKRWALEHDRTGGTHWRIGSNGSREFRTLGGRWVAESAVDAAHTRWGGNMSAMQWSVGYEMAKAATQEEQEYLFNNYGRLNSAGSGLNLSDGQMGGMWTGAAFAQQNTDRQYKHYAWNSGNGGQLRVSGTAMMREIDERQGNWQMMSQSADTWTTMSQEIARARRVASGQATPAEMGDMSMEDAQEVIQRGSRIAKSLGGGYRTEDGRWVDTGVGQGASGRTKEEIENFAALFDNKKQGRDDYMREVGMERRGSTTARSGDTYTAPTYDPVAGRYADRAAVDVEASGYRTEAPQTNDPTVQRSRNNPRGG